MVQANEIRLNNLFLYNYKTDLISSVEWIQPNSVNIVFDRQPDLVNGVVCSPHDLIPIQLTGEWLLKAGFELCEDWKHGIYRMFYWKYPFKIFIKNSDVTVSFKIESSTCINCKFVHQLQNLYFALTGEELVFSITEP